MAILNGLQKYSVTSSTLNGDGTVVPNPVLPPDLFDLINPSQNYAAYRLQFNTLPGVPFLFPHMTQAGQQGPAVLHELFQKVASV